MTRTPAIVLVKSMRERRRRIALQTSHQAVRACESRLRSARESLAKVLAHRAMLSCRQAEFSGNAADLVACAAAIEGAESLARMALERVRGAGFELQQAKTEHERHRTLWSTANEGLRLCKEQHRIERRRIVALQTLLAEEELSDLRACRREDGTASAWLPQERPR